MFGEGGRKGGGTEASPLYRSERGVHQVTVRPPPAAKNEGFLGEASGRAETGEEMVSSKLGCGRGS